MTPIVNLLTVDVEDYFHVSALAGVVPRARWDDFEGRVEAATSRLLDVFAGADAHATFFVLGWVAKRHPDLLRRIASAGHELASHSYSHRLVYEMTPDEFRHDLRRARATIEDAAGLPVQGFRAPSFSITRRSTWALDVLVQEGYCYDASIFPIRNDRYGIPSAPRHIHIITRNSGTIVEVPSSTVRFAGINVPVGGGGYLRILPYGWTRFGLKRLNNVERKPAMVYVHPWELDVEQPRLQAPLLGRFRHYYNLAQTEPRIRRLLSEFRFDSIRTVLKLM
jgi:polysaccharide deacetylase family protein (PEP-CTERM system associated)